MRDWRVSVLAALGFVGLLAGLFVLALPGPYEGAALYVLDAYHSLCVMDMVGLVLVALGGAATWGAGALWGREVGKEPGQRTAS